MKETNQVLSSFVAISSSRVLISSILSKEVIFKPCSYFSLWKQEHLIEDKQLPFEQDTQMLYRLHLLCISHQRELCHLPKLSQRKSFRHSSSMRDLMSWLLRSAVNRHISVVSIFRYCLSFRVILFKDKPHPRQPIFNKYLCGEIEDSSESLFYFQRHQWPSLKLGWSMTSLSDHPYFLPFPQILFPKILLNKQLTL